MASCNRIMISKRAYWNASPSECHIKLVMLADHLVYVFISEEQLITGSVPIKLLTGCHGFQN